MAICLERLELPKCFQQAEIIAKIEEAVFLLVFELLSESGIEGQISQTEVQTCEIVFWSLIREKGEFIC